VNIKIEFSLSILMLDLVL